MQKSPVLKQVLFLIFIAVILVLLMGLVIFSSAKAEVSESGTGLSARSSNSKASVRFFDEDEENWDSSKKRHQTEGEARYDRVEGLYLGLLLNQNEDRQVKPPRKSDTPFLYGSAGYTLKLKKFEGQMGIEKRFGEDNPLGVGAEFHSIVETPDRWIISGHENSLAAFLLCEDFRDYYFSEGAGGYVTQTLGSAVRMTAAYQRDQFDSLQKNTDWALFGGKKKFRENPAMSAGETRSIAGKIVFDTRNSPKNTTRGLYVQVEGERAGGDMGGNFDFDRLLADVRWYWTLDSWEGLDFRLRAGSVTGNAPWQKTFHLGGISTLRGFSYKAFPSGPLQPGGNRMALAQVEYTFGREDFPYGLDLGFLDQFNLILFSDAGWVGTVGTQKDLWEGFDGISGGAIKNDAGIALANRSGNVRLEVARRTDTGNKPYTFYFRIERPF
jgi:hypothetical protein